MSPLQLDSTPPTERVMDPPLRHSSSRPVGGVERRTRDLGLPLVVLAEDNVHLRTLLGLALELVGYPVSLAEPGAHLVAVVEAIAARGETVGLIITDVRMPVIGGFDAVRVLRESGHAAPLIFMTAYRDAWTRSKAIELGALLLDKPVSIAVLRSAVRVVLAM